ncbi:hypothetical protein [Parasediminibacterium sp. JCM 36343]|uniref:hypothetical protein n=1 Tax=Parasediminibacterium sp. JCM 36343 TaxID=3374279 RepID=UPI0039791A4F
MTDFSTIQLPDSIRQLSLYRRDRIYQLLYILQGNKLVSGVLLGGSLSYKNKVSNSDVDLFCLITQPDIFENNLKEYIAELNDIDEIIFQGSFPWTERLFTVYFTEDMDFSIDLCLISSGNAQVFFWEPNGCILFDKEGTLTTIRICQMASPFFTMHPFLKQNPFSLSVVTLKKIEKNLSRKHLWNALEQLNGLRRYIMQIVRLTVIKDTNFLGRVDRDIEDVIPSVMNDAFSKTVAVYDANSIAEKAILLIEFLFELQGYLKMSNENNVSEWIIKQLKHELSKLQNYLYA